MGRFPAVNFRGTFLITQDPDIPSFMVGEQSQGQ
jgi:hypothetical protein